MKVITLGLTLFIIVAIVHGGLLFGESNEEIKARQQRRKELEMKKAKLKGYVKKLVKHFNESPISLDEAKKVGINVKSLSLMESTIEEFQEKFRSFCDDNVPENSAYPGPLIYEQLIRAIRYEFAMLGKRLRGTAFDILTKLETVKPFELLADYRIKSQKDADNLPVAEIESAANFHLP